MIQVESENIKTNFIITPKPITSTNVLVEVKQEYIRLFIMFIFIFIIIILALKEYLVGLRFIQDLSITDTLMIEISEVNL